MVQWLWTAVVKQSKFELEHSLRVIARTRLEGVHMRDSVQIVVISFDNWSTDHSCRPIQKAASCYVLAIANDECTFNAILRSEKNGRVTGEESIIKDSFDTWCTRAKWRMFVHCIGRNEKTQVARLTQPPLLSTLAYL